MSDPYYVLSSGYGTVLWEVVSLCASWDTDMSMNIRNVRKLRITKYNPLILQMGNLRHIINPGLETDYLGY